MPREVHPTLQALIDTGHCNWHSTVDVELKGEEEPLLLSTGQLLLGDNQYTSNLVDVSEFSMGLDVEVDEVEFDAQNTDYVMGQTLTGFDNPLAGARGILGLIFINRLTQAKFYDAKMQGEIVTGEVGDEVVQFQIISDPDITAIAGRTIAAEFPWREPIHVNPVGNPDDLIPPGGFPGRGGRDPGDPMGPRGPGRYGDIGDIMPIYGAV